MTWIIANRKKAEACKTGGGPTPVPLTWAEDTVLGEESPVGGGQSPPDGHFCVESVLPHQLPRRGTDTPRLPRPSICTESNLSTGETRG